MKLLRGLTLVLAMTLMSMTAYAESDWGFAEPVQLIASADDVIQTMAILTASDTQTFVDELRLATFESYHSYGNSAVSDSDSTNLKVDKIECRYSSFNEDGYRARWTPC